MVLIFCPRCYLWSDHTLPNWVRTHKRHFECCFIEEGGE